MPLPEPYLADIRRAEGFRPKPYWDVNAWRWGHGTPAPGPTGTITREQADAELRRHAGTAAASVDRFKPGLPEGPRAALTSLTLNAGPGWQKAGLGKAVAAGDWADATNRFRQYNKARSPGGVLTEKPGLNARRAGEAQWFAHAGGPPSATQPNPQASSMPLLDAPPSSMPAMPGSRYLSPAGIKDLRDRSNFWLRQATTMPNRRLTPFDAIASALAGYNSQATRREADDYEAGERDAQTQALAGIYGQGRGAGPLTQPPGAAPAAFAFPTGRQESIEPSAATDVAGIVAGRGGPLLQPPGGEPTASPALMDAARAPALAGGRLDASTPSGPAPTPGMATTQPSPDARAKWAQLALASGPAGDMARRRIEQLDQQEQAAAARRATYTERARAAREHGGGVLVPGSREYNEYVLTGDFPRLANQQQQPEEQARARHRAAVEQGLDPSDPHVRQYILTGKFPREDQAPLTATDKKAILEADEAVLTNRGVITALDEALKLNDQVNTGFMASRRATLGNYLPDWLVPDEVSSPESSKATANFENLVLGQALQQLKSTFGAAPTEGERKILVDLQSSVNQPPEVRKEILDRARRLAQARLEFNEQRARDMRGQTYFKPRAQGTPGETASVTPPGLVEPGNIDLDARPSGTQPAPARFRDAGAKRAAIRDLARDPSEANQAMFGDAFGTEALKEALDIIEQARNAPRPVQLPNPHSNFAPDGRFVGAR